MSAFWLSFLVKSQENACGKIAVWINVDSLQCPLPHKTHEFPREMVLPCSLRRLGSTQWFWPISQLLVITGWLGLVPRASSPPVPPKTTVIWSDYNFTVGHVANAELGREGWRSIFSPRGASSVSTCSVSKIIVGGKFSVCFASA